MSSASPSSRPSCFTKVVDLNGTWQLRWNDGERGERPDRVTSGGVDWSRAWEARVPGCVHGTLIEEGVIPDPAAGTNVLVCRWVEETIWIYRRTFSCAALSSGSRAWLRFEQLDLAARIFLNGKLVGTHANQFRPFEADVSTLLREGENEVIVEIEAGLHMTRDRSAEGLGVKTNYLLTKMPWMRKTHNQHGWDWAPRLLNVGMQGDVRLEIVSGPHWEGCAVTAVLSEDHQTGTVDARVFVDLPEADEMEVVLRVAGRKFAETQSVEAGRQTLFLEGAVEQPELWWPIGHGAQPLYPVEVELRRAGHVIGSATRRVGFRTIHFRQDPHPGGGRFFTLEVNGKPVFCKGSNYVPADLLLSRITRERHERNLRLAREANFNFLRVWGGGIYESEDFYELCDEQGILVWQDFIFACAKYPATEESFTNEVRREVRHQIRRMQHHASLIAWCGNNELEWAAWDWGFEKGVTHPDHALFHLVIPRLLREEDPARYYQPSSPWSPDGENPNSDLCGDQHAWQVGFGERDFRKYRERVCRFPTEWGFLGPGSLPALKAALQGGPEKPGTFAWELHDNALSSWDSIDPYNPDLAVREWTGIPLSDMSLEDYVYFAGLVQSGAYAEGIRNFRRRMFTCSASVFWMFNEIWPAVRGCAIVDALGHRTPSFWAVKRAMAPVTVSVVRERETVTIYGINDGPSLEAELHYGLVGVEGNYPLDQRARVTLAANASTPLAEFPAALWDQAGKTTHAGFARLLVGGKEIARNILILPMYSEIRWREARVAVTHTNGTATFTSDTLAWQVCLDLDGNHALPDNFFDILPGIPVELDWPDPLPAPVVLRTGNEISPRSLRVHL